MKTTLKLDGATSLVVEPVAEAVSVTVRVGAVPMKCVFLTLAQVGAMLSALEGAAEAAQLNRGGAAA